jgi:hypothetical protein
LDVLQALIASYNDTKHSTIKMAPNEVGPHNEVLIRQMLQTPSKVARNPTKRFKIGDSVRISGTKLNFPTKGYKEKWTRELFKVFRIYKTQPATYGLTDTSSEEILGKFYAPELTKANKEVFAVEKVLKTRRGKGGKKEYFVKWQDYSDKFNSWTDHISAI